MEKIGILGCGWLGGHLAKYFLSRGKKVSATSRSPEKLKILQTEGIKAYYLDLNGTQRPQFQDFFAGLDVIIVCLPQATKEQASSYIESLRILKDAAASHQVPYCLFLSSTSVYPLRADVFDEYSELNKESILRQAETVFRLSSNIQCTLLRLGRIVGGGKTIDDHLRNIEQERSQFFNLIHLEDVLQIIYLILEEKAFPDVFNVVSSHQTSIGEVIKASQNKNFDEEYFSGKVMVERKISNEKLCRRLNYHFQFPKPLL